MRNILFVLVGLGILAVIAVVLIGPSREVPAKPPVIGVVLSAPAFSPAFEGVKAGLRELGFEEGKNISYVVKETTGEATAVGKAIDEVLGTGATLLLTPGVLTTQVAKKKTTTIPIVFTIVSDPVGEGIAESLKSSGNNITGTNPTNEILVAKRAELLRELLPNAKRLLFPYNNPRTAGLENLRRAAEKLGFALEEREVKDLAAFDALLKSIDPLKTDAIMRATDSLSSARAKALAELAIRLKIPLMGTNSTDTEMGAVMSFGPNFFLLGKQTARLVEKVLKGARPQDLPIEPPNTVEFSLNAKTAKAIGVSLPPGLLERADRVIER